MSVYLTIWASVFHVSSCVHMESSFFLTIIVDPAEDSSAEVSCVAVRILSSTWQLTLESKTLSVCFLWGDPQYATLPQYFEEVALLSYMSVLKFWGWFLLWLHVLSFFCSSQLLRSVKFFVSVSHMLGFDFV